jgi:hypothetical protein
MDALPTNEQFLASLRERLADTERLATNARKRGDSYTATQADQICEEWRRMITRAGGNL